MSAQKSLPIKLLLGVSTVAILATGGARITGAHAQEATNDEPVLEEIVVTARRYAEKLSDAPLAINVMTDNYLIDQRVESVRDILELTPGASFVSFSKAQPEKSMRGVVAPTPGNSSSEQSIQNVVDGLVITKDFMKSGPIYDLDHVEVLRGPQGTTFGRNASIGLIQLISKKPTREYEAGLNATAGNGRDYETDGYISGPLSEDWSGRFAFNFDTQDGPTESISTGRGLDGDSNFAFRGSLIYDPDSSFSAYLKVEYSEDNDEAPVRRGNDCTKPTIDGPRAFAPLPPPLSFQHPPYSITFIDSCDVFKTEISTDRNFFFKRHVLTTTANISFDVAEGITVTSITGYMDGGDNGLADVLGTPVNIVFQKIHNDGWLFSEETRIDNHAQGERYRWLAGVYYLHDEEDRFEQNQFFQGNSLPFPRVPSFLATISSNETDSIALFGELAYDLSDKVELAASGRWTHDQKDYLYSVEASGFRPVIAGVTGCTPAVGIVCGSPANPVGFDFIPVKDSWSDFSGRVSLQYHVDDDNMLYALWSQGFKSGGFQPDARTAAAARISFKPEHSNNYELGWKTNIAGRARIALTAFYLQNKGNQTVTLIPVGAGFTGLISNLGAIRTKGIEGEWTWLINSSFRTGGSVSLMDPTLHNTVLTVGVDNNGNPVLDDLSGQRPEVAPRWTATAYMEYEYVYPGGSTLTVRGDFIGRDRVFDDFSERATRARIRPTLTNLGLRITWLSPDGKYRIMGWGENLNQDFDIENIGPSQPNTLQLPFGFSRKRTYGVTASVRY